MAQRSRKRRYPRSARVAAAGGEQREAAKPDRYARSRERDAAVRAALQPLRRASVRAR